MNSGKFHRYTEEEHSFLRCFIHGHTYKEITAEFNKRFDEPITEGKLKSYMSRYKINNGLKGYFPKGHIPYNKGMKGICAKGSEKAWFKKGHIPKNARPMGSERINKDGYIEIKVREHKTKDKPNTFERKHRVIWEEAHGEIPQGHVIIFKDGDKTNCNLSNLAVILRAEHQQMTRKGLRSENPKLTEIGILIAKMGVAAKKAEKKKINGGNMQ